MVRKTHIALVFSAVTTLVNKYAASQVGSWAWQAPTVIALILSTLIALTLNVVYRVYLVQYTPPSLTDQRFRLLHLSSNY